MKKKYCKECGKKLVVDTKASGLVNNAGYFAVNGLKVLGYVAGAIANGGKPTHPFRSRPTEVNIDIYWCKKCKKRRVFSDSK